MSAHVCPEHGSTLKAQETRWGERFACPKTGCTVVSWRGNPPADYETRQARIAAHAAFDRLWSTKSERARRYKQLATWLNVSPQECHIAHFDRPMCERVIEFTETLEDPT